MKKILYTTTALVAATVISSAAMADMGASSRSGSSMKSMKMNSASQLQSTRYMQENDMMGASAFKASVGGYANWYMGYADQDVTGVNEFDVMGDAEIHFNFDAALKNGLKIGVHTAVETDTATFGSTAQIEQTYMYVESMYGKVIAGRHDNVNEQLSFHAIDVGALDIQESDFTRFVLDGTNEGLGMSTYFNLDQELTKLSYISPKFHGFQAGVTYAPANSSPVTNDNVTRGSYDSTIITAAYDAMVDGVGFGVSAGYAFATDLTSGSDNIDEWNVGAKVEYKGFAVAAAYRNVDIDNVGETTIWDTSISYETGPYAMSLSYIRGDSESDTMSTMLLSGAYNMAAGVDAFATVGYGDYEAYKNASNITVGNKGWAVITGMMLSF